MIVRFRKRYVDNYEDAIQLSKDVKSNLERILDYLRMKESNLSNRTLQVQNYRKYPENSYLYFLNKGKMCLKLSSKFLSITKNNDYMIWSLGRNRGTYNQLKDQLNDLRARLSLFTTWEEIIRDSNFKYTYLPDAEERTLLIYVDIVDDERRETQFSDDFEELRSFYRTLFNFDERNEWINMIEATNSQINDVFRTMYLPIQQVLDDYSNKLDDHLKTRRRRTYQYYQLNKRLLKLVKKRKEEVEKTITDITQI